MESTVVCVDNSEFTRNGDYAPTRFQAQADAVNLLAGAKTQHHPENTVGVMSMAGKTPQVLVTPTPDLGKVLNAMQQMKIEGQVNLSTSVQVAQLALKHRENKNQRQRIVIFLGSPVTEDKARARRNGRRRSRAQRQDDAHGRRRPAQNARPASGPPHPPHPERRRRWSRLPRS
jgi:26S proteasome regulatory subunit N10